MIRWIILFFQICASINSKEIKDDMDRISTKLFFLNENSFSGRDVLHVEAKSVKTISTSFFNTGFRFGESNIVTKGFVNELKQECFNTREDIEYELKHGQCLTKFISRNKRSVQEFFDVLPGQQCSDKFVLFARKASNPQNLHYDTVKFEELACEDIVPHSKHQKIYLRHWYSHFFFLSHVYILASKTEHPLNRFPLVHVNSAPLLLSNTTRLYDNACSRRSTNTQENQSPSWLIPSKHEFLNHCKQRQEIDEIFSETCAWYHTLDMHPGEYMSFRNGMVLHGSAPVRAVREEDEEEPLRLSFAVDCEYRLNYEV